MRLFFDCSIVMDVMLGASLDVTMTASVTSQFQEAITRQTLLFVLANHERAGRGLRTPV